jgi:hypothetical protein
MRKYLYVLGLLLAAMSAGAQNTYEPEALRGLGLNDTEIDGIREIVQDVQPANARLMAELNIKKAELARLLVDENPNQRQIERNLRESAEIEVQLRMIEIRRELAIREVVGTDRWTAILRAFRTRNRLVTPQEAREIIESLTRAQSAFRERQEEIARRLREAGNADLATQVLSQLREIERLYRETAELLRQR